jgi:hypothetical protein
MPSSAKYTAGERPNQRKWPKNRGFWLTPVGAAR